MKEMILIGGIPCSGKSFLTNRLIRNNPKTYVNLGIDIIYDYIEANSRKFFMYLNILNPDLIENLGINFKKDKIKKLNAKKKILKNYLNENGIGHYWEKLLQGSGNIYFAEKLLNLDNSNKAVVESLFLNRRDRTEGHLAFKEYMGIVHSLKSQEIFPLEKNLDNVKKTLIYLNLGLEVSLERFYNSQNLSSMLSKELILHAYEHQEIPLSNELPNLEVVLLESQKQIDDFFVSYKKY